jgi:hypothetical protein
MSVFYTDHITEWLTVPARLFHEFDTVEWTIIRKLQLMLSFGTGFKELIMLALALCIFKFVLSIWSSLSIVGEELIYLGFAYLDLYHFWIRQSHSGIDFVVEEQHRQIGESDLGLLEEPNQEPVLVFLARGTSAVL